MKINLSPNDRKEFEKLLTIKDNNIEISDLLLSAFQYVDFIDVDYLLNKVANGEQVDSAIKNIILDSFEINDLSFREDFNNQVVINKCEPSFYINEYVKLLDKFKLSYGKYNLKKVTYEPYQLFAFDDIDIGNDYREISKVGYFEKKFSYAALFEGKDLWMSLNPNEINTMDSTIKNARGKVLVLGLGMGYITYMLSNKKNISSITVVERNKENIALFKKYLFPLFENKAKITIIQDDAINYVNSNNKYDYIFADLWFNPEDGLEYYLKLHDIEHKNKIEIDYWLETSLKQMKRRYLIELIKEQLNGSDESCYKSEEELADRIFKKLYLDTKHLEINAIEDIRNLLKCDQ